MVVFALMFILLGWILGVVVLVSGRFIARRKHYNFGFVVACVECLLMPFGTVLGVFNPRTYKQNARNLDLRQFSVPFSYSIDCEIV